MILRQPHVVMKMILSIGDRGHRIKETFNSYVDMRKTPNAALKTIWDNASQDVHIESLSTA